MVVFIEKILDIRSLNYLSNIPIFLYLLFIPIAQRNKLKEINIHTLFLINMYAKGKKLINSPDLYSII